MGKMKISFYPFLLNLVNLRKVFWTIKYMIEQNPSKHTLCAHTPLGALMPEVRAAPTLMHANTTCCHSNRGRDWWNLSILHSSVLYFLSYWLVYPFVYLLFSSRITEQGDKDGGMEVPEQWHCTVFKVFCLLYGGLLPTHLTPTETFHTGWLVLKKQRQVWNVTSKCADAKVDIKSFPFFALSFWSQTLWKHLRETSF